jgi:Tfp pilus assembly protein PilO
MSKNKTWVIGAVLIIVLIMGIGYIVGIQPQLSAISNANQKRASVQMQNATTQALLVKLKKDYQNIAGLQRQLNALRSAVPSSAEIPTFVTELNALASAHQITVLTVGI